MDKALFLFSLLVCSSYAQFFSPGARPGPFSGPPQPPRQGQFFPRPQQPGILRQLANLFGLDGGPSANAPPPPVPGVRGPGGPRPVPTNQQLFRPDSPLLPGPNPGQRNPQPPAISDGLILPPRNFQRLPPQGQRQPPFTEIQQQQLQGGRIPLGSTQILTFQPEDVRPPPAFENIPISSGSQPGSVAAAFLQQQPAPQGIPIRPSEPLLTQPIANHFSNDLGGVIQSSGALQAPFPRFPQEPPRQENPIELVSAPSLSQTSTLRDILKEDCKDFEERGYCDSAKRYPTLQILDLVKRCSSILDALYVPVPESNDISSTLLRKDKKEGNPLRNIERANQAVWSWAKYAAEKSSVCKSESRRVTPSYARDISQKWVVVLQNVASNMIQHVPMDKCKDVDKECLSGPEGDRHPGTRCTQRYTHHHLVTWDPDKPQECPSLRAFSFPTACLCHFSLSPFIN